MSRAIAQPNAGLIALLAAVTATGPLAMQIFLPALPAVQRDFETTAAVVQLTLSLSLLAIAIATLAYGPLSDRYGRRPVLLVGLGLFLFGTLVCVLASGIEVLIFGRIVQAAGGAAGMVLARAVVRDVWGHEQAAGAIARLTMVMVVAPMVAPAIGGLLTDLFAWRAVFWFSALAGVVIAFWTAIRLPETHVARGRADGARDILRGFAHLLGSGRFRAYVAHTAFSSMMFFAFISGAPYLMVDVLERPATEYGLWFMAASLGFMAGNFLAIRTSGRWSVPASMLTGTLLGLAGVAISAGLVWAGHLSPLGLFLPITLTMVGNGLAMPNAQAGALNVFPHRAGTASGFSGFSQMMLSAVAIQAVGQLHDGTAWPMLMFMSLGAGGALIAACSIVRLERIHRGARDAVSGEAAPIPPA